MPRENQVRTLASNLVAFWLAAPAAEPKRVLLLHSFGAGFAPWSVMAGRFREELVKHSPSPIDLYEVSLETARFKEADDEAPLVEYLRALFQGRQLDLVVVNAAPANRSRTSCRPFWPPPVNPV